MVSTNNAPDPARQRRRLTTTHARHILAASGLLFATLTVMPPAAVCPAQEPVPEARVREIYVPFDAISGILGGENERVFLTREEYKALEAEARQRPPEAVPQPVVLLSAAYQATLREGVAVFTGQLELEVLADGLQSVPLAFESVAVRSALLDGAAAPLARGPQGLELFVRAKGRHKLELEFHTPVVVSAAQQSLQLRIPTAGSSTLQVAVPGNVEVKSGTQVVARAYDAATDLTRFELLQPAGPLAVVMSLNNRRLREDRVVLSRNVLVAELTTSYERLHATLEMNVLHGAVDHFLFDVPAGFQITSVASPLLSQWVIRSETAGDVLEVTLREATRGREVLNIAATRSPVTIGEWTMPTLKPRDVAGQVAVVGVLAETRLRPLSVTGEQLIPIDTSVLRSALPESVFEAEPGAPEIRPIAAFYGPGESFQLQAAFEDPRDELRVATHLLLSLGEDQQMLRGGFTLTPQAAKQASFAFRMPRDWQLQKVTGADQQPLAVQRYPLEHETRFVVSLPAAIEPGTSVTIYFEASFRSSAWLGRWTSQEVEFPHLTVEQATDTTGAVAVQPTGDLTAKPLTVEGLTPLDSNQRGRFGLAESSNELTYQVTADSFKAVFRVERKQPQVTTRNYSFFEVRDGLLRAHYEIVYVIERAHTDRLQFDLPDTTPATVAVRGLQGLQLKESSQVTENGTRTWTAFLAESRIGTVILAIDFEERIDEAAAGNLMLPLVQTRQVAYQTQMVAVESGDPTLDVDVQTKMRSVDVGELAETEYTPGLEGRQLLGAFASTADASSVAAAISHRDLRPLPAAIVQRAELVTLVSNAGVSQSAARYLLQTKRPYLAVQFPPQAELWSVSLNGKPVKPRKRNDQIVVSLQAEEGGLQRDLQIVYEVPVSGMGWVGQIQTQAPQLRLLQDEKDEGQVVPQVDLIWHVHLPTGYRVSRVQGTVFTSQIPVIESPWRTLAQAGTTVGGGIYGPPVMMLAASRAARESAAKSRFAPASSAEMAPQAAVEFDAYAYTPAPAPPAGPGGGGGPTVLFTAPAADSAPQTYRADALTAPTVAPPMAGEEMAKQPAPAQEPYANDFAGAAEGRQLAVPPATAAGSTPADPTGAMGGYPGSGGVPGSAGPTSGMGGMGGGMGAMGGGRPGGSMMPNGQAVPPGSELVMDGANRGAMPSDGQPALQQSGAPSQPADASSFQAAHGGEVPARDANNQRFGSLDITEGMVAGKPAAPQPTTASSKLARYWALQGLSGLSIKIDQSKVSSTSDAGNEPVTFVSLGNDPQLDITVYQQTRMSWLSGAVALIIIVTGLWRTHSSVRSRVFWVIVLSLLACGLPILGGPLTEYQLVFRAALLATLALVPLWIVIACVERCVRALRRVGLGVTELSSAAAILMALSAAMAIPADLPAQDLNQLLQPVLDQDKPVRIPDDAVVIPYDPSDLEQREQAGKVLVPYARYVELWNLAHPDQKIGEQAPPVPFAFAAASYETVLEDADNITVRGHVEVELFTDKPTEVPLALMGGVITSAVLDGQPARLKAVLPDQAPAPAQQVQVAPAQLPPAMLTLLAEGQGRHRLELTIRVAVTRQGGSRTVNAVVPYTEANAINITVPNAETNVRRTLGATTLSETTTQTPQVLAATLGEGGRLEWTWRARVTPGSVDQALTAESLAVIDVREDGLHVTWKLDFRFGQSDRSGFRVEVPRDYLVELVEGKNVRGWDLVNEGEQSFLNVELLKAVKETEQFVVHLSRRMVFAPGQSTPVAVPYVSVPDAALHRGTLQLRRSTIIELQTSASQGVSRTDSVNVSEQLAGSEVGFGSPLAVQDYQTYKFANTPFQIGLVVAQTQPRLTAEVRTIFRLGETESALESEVQLLAQHRSVFQVRIDIPTDLELEQVAAAGLSDWSIQTTAGQRTLTAFFAAGQVDRFALSLRGKLADHATNAAVSLPRILVRDVDQQQGMIVAQVDSSLEARATALTDCRPILLERVTSWLTEAQRPLARLALEYQGDKYAGSIAISPRAARVSCVTLTNVRVTFREIQETILLDFKIVEAGVRRITFRLPAALKDAHISAPRIREQNVTPVEGEPFVRVTLDLQDAISGDYRVVVENDRALAADQQAAPLPLVDEGTTILRYVTLESAGRDEIVVEETPGMEPVTRDSRQWEELSARLQGGVFASAYVTSQANQEASFRYRMKQREIVKTAGASIGLARTDLVLDASGAYRAVMMLKVDNRTEPYLQLELPPGAALWTAHVAGQPVKPARALGQSSEQVVRIPLIKTAEGDLDFPVVLKYAGQFGSLQSLQTVQVPMIKAMNINIEMSQVQLHLPTEYEWFDFPGTRVQGEDDFAAGYVAYRTQQVEKLTQIMRGENTFSKARAMGNVAVLGKELQDFRRTRVGQSANEQLRVNLDANSRVVQEAASEMEDLQVQVQEQLQTDNRERLNSYWEAQDNGLARNEATRLSSNFAVPETPAAAPQSVEKFNQQWFDANALVNKAESAPEESKPEAQSAGKRGGLKRLQVEQSGRAQARSKKDSALDDRAAVNVFQGQQGQQAQQSLAEGDGAKDAERGTTGAQQGGQTVNQQEFAEDSASTEESLSRRYVDKIQQKLSANLPATDMPQGGPIVDSGTVVTWDDSKGQQLAADLDAGLAGLVSLDFELPQRGRTYYFMTPRGDVEIAMRPFEGRLLGQLQSLAALIALIVSVLVGWWLVGKLTRTHRSRVGVSVLLMLVGVGLLIGGAIPIFAIAMVLAGILLMLREREAAVA